MELTSDYGFVTTLFTRNQYLALLFRWNYIFIIFYQKLKDVSILLWLELLLWIQERERERERERESKILAKKDHFRSLLKLTSVENAKSEESKEVNHLADKTFSFVNIESVICFPMPIGTKFELEVAKICISADDNLLVLWKVSMR